MTNNLDETIETWQKLSALSAQHQTQLLLQLRDFLLQLHRLFAWDRQKDDLTGPDAKHQMWQCVKNVKTHGIPW